MVQQQQQLAGTNFVAGPAAQTNGGFALDQPGSLAMPAIISTNSNTNQTQQSQYSPQASLYQQQLIKSAHQFAQQQQQQTRLNGINGTANLIQQQQYSTASQQNSPQNQANQFGHNNQESFYGASNGLQQTGRPAPIYAPKPAYYGQIAQQQAQTNQNQMFQTGARQMQPPVQQLQVASNYLQPQQQQQHSPAVNQAQLSISLAGGRQVQSQPILQNANGLNSVGTSQSAIDQQQRQMQQLVMSYQQQQQQHQEQLQLQLQHQNSYLVQPNRLAPILSRQMEPSSASGNLWPVVESQSQLKAQPVFGSAIAQQPTSGQPGRPLHRPHVPASDRDSVSTLSRFNQLDDRRSFTMRSQYTTNAQGKSGRQFGFVELTSEAVRQMLGFDSAKLASSSTRQPLLGVGPNTNEQLRQNLSLSVAGGGGTCLEQAQKIGQTGQQQAGARVTIIDSGDERHFGRKVLGYRLAISRLLNVLLSAVVLLSPVVMLLLPKMEPLIRGSSELTSSALEYNAHEPSLAPANAVTHAVGLVGQRQLAKAASVQQQPQWRISECQSSDCDGPLIGFFVRLILLAIAHYAIFFRPQTATLPRVDFQRCLLISMALLVITAYWLFFVFRVFDKRYNDFELQYMTIVQFSISMLETLILLHYLALVLIEVRHRKRVYCLKVVRSPDGDSKYYSCGTLSIQKCAQFVLEKYHRDFGQFDSYKEQLLAAEDELAHHLKRQRQAQNHDSSNEQSGAIRARRPSRPSSPRRTANDELDDDQEETGDQDGHERSASRRSRRRHHHRRHHSSASRQTEADEAADNAGQLERSVSRSPSRSRRPARPGNSSRPHSDESSDEHNARKRTRGERSSDDDDDKQVGSPGTKRTPQRREANKTTESADLSSDATSRVKESSLDTIKAANGAADERPTAAAGSKPDLEISDRPKHQQQARPRDETESVRSARSRRSTGSRMHRSQRSESRHHSTRHQRERSSSRARAHTAIEVEGGGGSELQGHAAELDAEHERKLRRRKLRLLAAVEDSFEQVRLLDEGTPKQTTDHNGCLRQANATGLDASQAARSVYPNIARPLQKYLRLTKQTGRHNLQSIYEHLAKCLLYRLSARTFLDKFTKFDSVWQQNETNLFANCRLFNQIGHANKPAERELQLNSWSLICDTLLSRQIDSGTFFVLKQGQVSLLVTVAKLPHLSLSEQVVDQNSCRFAFGPNPETTSV